MNQETLEQTFHVTSPARLQVSNIRGSVDVQAAEDGIISILAVKNLDSGNADRTKIVIDQDKDGGIQVHTKYPENGAWLFKNSKPCKVDYTIRVPTTCSLSITGVSSTTAAHGVNGAVSVNSVSGSVRLSEIDGKISLNTVSGPFTGENLTGSLEVDAVSGATNILNSKLDRINVSTLSGDSFLDTSLGKGPYRFNTISGDVKLKLPEGSSYTIRTNSISGRVKTSHQNHNAFLRRGKKIIENGGGVLIHHNSISGDFAVDSGVTPSRESASNDVSTSSNPNQRMQILDRIASGEISVEDALRSFEEA
jgi:hypothetical protein